MREIIPTRLWIGNAMDARNVTGVLGLGIAAVVDLAIEEPPIQFPRDVVYCRFPLIDGTGNQPAVLRVAIDTVAYFIASRTPTLVACGAGNEPVTGHRRSGDGDDETNRTGRRSGKADCRAAT